ncbi:hypothetical protein [Mycolicibacterium goodii]|uniref:hypothetical protein n=1 Tax=Mycolicibacterium goodii TaxID=134601 RepID=UPI000AA0E5D3
MTIVPGHTPGQIVTHVTTKHETVVRASDALHFYGEMELNRPFQIFIDRMGMYEAFEYLRELDAQPHTTIVAGHDPAVTERFVHAAEACADLTRPHQSS